MSQDKLIVSEIFYSIQGEGPSMGRPAIFLRLAGCNLLCGGKGTDLDKQLHDGATWRCDTIEVWKKGRAYSFRDLFIELQNRFSFAHLLRRGAHLIITGGEPLIQQAAILGFIRYYYEQCRELGYIEIETNGTIIPSPELEEMVSQWNVSPKLKNSGMNYLDRFVKESITWFLNTDSSIFKWVISSKSDFEEIRVLCALIKKERIWLMPAASNRIDLEKASKLVAEICMDEGVNFSTRLQVAIWNEITGK